MHWAVHAQSSCSQNIARNPSHYSWVASLGAQAVCGECRLVFEYAYIPLSSAFAHRLFRLLTMSESAFTSTPLCPLAARYMARHHSVVQCCRCRKVGSVPSGLPAAACMAQVVKYGVISCAALEDDLRTWRYLYAGVLLLQRAW